MAGRSLLKQESWPKGETQPSACKDAIFAVLFISQVVGIAAVVILFGSEFVVQAIDGDTDSDYTGYIYAAISIGIVSLILSALMFQLMIRFANSLIKIALRTSVLFSFIIAFTSLFAGNIIGFVLGLIFGAISLCYMYAVWSRIPFATSNLITSLKAIKENAGITIVSYALVILAFAWTMLWTTAAIVTYEKTTVCDDNGECTINSGYAFLLFLSYFWTQQVIMNTIQVTVAGVVGTWWFVPEEASSCCSSAVTGSLFRATTSSFGSICFGSLIVAVIQAVRQLAQQARSQGEGNQLLLCIADCLLSLLESIVLYFNKWAYVYVGVYGYGYLDAGKNVMSLFRARGWEAVIADDLVGGALALISLITGLLCGAIAVVLELTTGWFAESGEAAEIIAFVLGFLVGYIVCAVMLNIVAAGVNTVIVLFAEAPAEFQTNHPELSNDMRQAYTGAYPDLF